MTKPDRKRTFDKFPADMKRHFKQIEKQGYLIDADYDTEIDPILISVEAVDELRIYPLPDMKCITLDAELLRYLLAFLKRGNKPARRMEWP